MSQKSSLLQPVESVSWALMPDIAQVKYWYLPRRVAWEIHELHVRLGAKLGEHDFGFIQKGPRSSGAHIIEAGRRARFLECPKSDPHAVVNPDEIANLAAVSVIGIIRMKQTHSTPLTDLRMQLNRNRSLPALVIFVRSVDIEEF